MIKATLHIHSTKRWYVEGFFKKWTTVTSPCWLIDLITDFTRDYLLSNEILCVSPYIRVNNNTMLSALRIRIWSGRHHFGRSESGSASKVYRSGTGSVFISTKYKAKLFNLPPEMLKIMGTGMTYTTTTIKIKQCQLALLWLKDNNIFLIFQNV